MPLGVVLFDSGGRTKSRTQARPVKLRYIHKRTPLRSYLRF